MAKSSPHPGLEVTVPGIFMGIIPQSAIMNKINGLGFMLKPSCARVELSYIVH